MFVSSNLLRDKLYHLLAKGTIKKGGTFSLVCKNEFCTLYLKEDLKRIWRVSFEFRMKKFKFVNRICGVQ